MTNATLDINNNITATPTTTSNRWFRSRKDQSTITLVQQVSSEMQNAAVDP